MSRSARFAFPLACVVSVCWPSLAKAFDAGELDGKPVRVDITETSLLNYRFNNRNDINPADIENRIDDNYIEWLNRFNITASWKNWQAGIRFDTATYGLTKKVDDFSGVTERRNAGEKLAFRFRDLYVVPPLMASKLYVTYATPDVELTAGDAYVSFGRGLVLSVRKLDELASDTSVQGAKMVARYSPFSIIAVAGLSNPIRIDEATSVTLRDAAPTDTRAAASTWARDFITGLRLEGKIGSSTLGIHAADVIRREDLGFGGDATTGAKAIQSAGISFGAPRIGNDLPLNLYVEAAYQHRSLFQDDAENKKINNGYALYTSLSGSKDNVTVSLEGKHYRAFFPVRQYADPSKFGAFRAVQYNAPPTLELVTQDSLFDNSCVSGGRARVDYKISKSVLLYGAFAYTANWSQRENKLCDAGPTLGLTVGGGNQPRNDVFDGYAGFELRSQEDSSYLIVSTGMRNDKKSESGDLFYREYWTMLDAVKTLTDTWSLEFNGWHRRRIEDAEGTWHEGQTYFGVKYTSSRAIFIGHEYTSRPSIVKQGAFLVSTGNTPVQHYMNVGMQLKFGDAVQLRIFAGQQRGALKCVSGVCRFFPAFEGIRSELVVRL